MAKKSKGKLQTRKEKRRPAARRQERRFIAHTSTSPMLVYALGGPPRSSSEPAPTG
jgi:hypothetical protein